LLGRLQKKKLSALSGKEHHFGEMQLKEGKGGVGRREKKELGEKIW